MVDRRLSSSVKTSYIGIKFCGSSETEANRSKEKRNTRLGLLIVTGPAGSHSAVLTLQAGAGTGVLRWELRAASPGGLVTVRAPGQGA